MRARPVLHAVFNDAASGNLKQALGRPRRDGIIVLRDDLSIGPIDRTDGESRTRWLQEQFGDDAWEPIADIDTFWSEVTSSEACIVAWVNRRDAREHAGLLELLRQRGGAPLEIVDVTDVEFTDLEARPLQIADIPPEQTIKLKLVESAAPISASAKLSFAQNWARLRQENASLRIIENEALVSASANDFDARLVSYATPEWQSGMRMLGLFYGAARAEGFNPPDLRFVLSRLVALVEAGQLEAEGDVSTLEGYARSRVMQRGANCGPTGTSEPVFKALRRSK